MTTATTITIEQLIAEVRKLAEEQPDTIYMPPLNSDACIYHYLTDETGKVIHHGCIFGQAFRRLGISNETLIEFDKSCDTTISHLLNHLQISSHEDQLSWCRIVQGEQDTQASWRSAVREANLASEGV